MPLYEYECQSCGNRLEAQQRLADAPLVTCPKCGKDELQKVISATAFVLKGGGWYKDLYASSKPGSDGSSSKASTDGSSTSSTSSEPKSESKSESKPASTSESGSTATPSSTSTSTSTDKT